MCGVSTWLSAHDVLHAVRIDRWSAAQTIVDAPEIATPADSLAVRTDALAIAIEAPAPGAQRKAVRDRITDLAAELDGDAFDRMLFDTRARAIAAQLDEAEMRAALEVAGDRSAGLRMIVCAAEIVRLCNERSPTAASSLAPATRELLRRAFDGCAEDPRLAFAGVRALAALGDDEDRKSLVEALASRTDARKRDLAGLGLCAAAATDTVSALTSFVARANDTRCSELALIALADIWRSARAESLPTDERETCARCIASCLATRDAPLVLRERAITALAAIGGTSAREGLLATFTDAGADRVLVRSAAGALAALDDPVAAESLAKLLSDPLLDDEQRVLATGAIARSSVRSAELGDARPGH